MMMDISPRIYRNIGELEQYCYRVAGVVGLMFCHIVGVSCEQALRHAVSLRECYAANQHCARCV